MGLGVFAALIHLPIDERSLESRKAALAEVFVPPVRPERSEGSDEVKWFVCHVSAYAAGQSLFLLRVQTGHMVDRCART